MINSYTLFLIWNSLANNFHKFWMMRHIINFGSRNYNMDGNVTSLGKGQLLLTEQR